MKISMDETSLKNIEHGDVTSHYSRIYGSAETHQE